MPFAPRVGNVGLVPRIAPAAPFMFACDQMGESKVNLFRGPLPITLLRSYTSTRTRSGTRVLRDTRRRAGATSMVLWVKLNIPVTAPQRCGLKRLTRRRSIRPGHIIHFTTLHHARSLNGSRIAHSDTHLWATRAVVYSTYTVDIVTKHSSITLASYCVNIPTPLSGF